MKIEDMPKAGDGSALSEEEADKVIEAIYADARSKELVITPMLRPFIVGYAAGLSFASTPKEAGTCGFDPVEYGENAYCGLVGTTIEDALSKVKENIDSILGDLNAK